MHNSKIIRKIKRKILSQDLMHQMYITLLSRSIETIIKMMYKHNQFAYSLQINTWGIFSMAQQIYSSMVHP